MSREFTLEDWESLVAQIASPEGYSAYLCLDDYYQDIGYRVTLEAVAGSTEFRERLEAADATFRANTLGATDTRLSGEHWWHFRLPLRGGDGILEEARACGLL